MNITTENEIDGAAAKALRAGLSQKAFWGAYGITQAGGSRYEQGKSPIPKALRRLIFAEHVAGLVLDASTDKGAAEVVRVGKLAEADSHTRQAERLLSEINQ